MEKFIFSLVKISTVHAIYLLAILVGTICQLWSLSLAQGPGGCRLVRAAGHQAALLGVPPADINHKHMYYKIDWIKILT